MAGKDNAAYLSADGKVAFDRYGRQIKETQEAKKQEQPQAQAQSSRNENDYITPRHEHPDNAVYVARDKKSGAEVSFDARGRKLDSNGNVVWGDRQRAGDAGARIIRRDEPQQYQANPSIGTVMTTGQPVQRSTWDNSPVAPVQGAASSGGLAVNRPVRESLQNYDTFAARNGWRSPSNWEAGNTWRGAGASADNAMPLPQQGQSYVPPTVDNSVPAPAPFSFPNLLSPTAFQDAAQNWGPTGLPMPNAAQYDPYPEQQFSVYPMRRTYNNPGLPMPNNQVFDPYR